MIGQADAHYLHQPIPLRDNSARSHAGKLSDGALIAAIARGDQQAMRRLYERHRVHVYRCACRLGVDQGRCQAVARVVARSIARWRKTSRRSTT